MGVQKRAVSDLRVKLSSEVTDEVLEAVETDNLDVHQVAQLLQAEGPLPLSLVPVAAYLLEVNAFMVEPASAEADSDGEQRPRITCLGSWNPQWKSVALLSVAGGEDAGAGEQKEGTVYQVLSDAREETTAWPSSSRIAQVFASHVAGCSPAAVVVQGLAYLAGEIDPKMGNPDFRGYSARVEAKQHLVKNGAMIQRKHDKGYRVKTYSLWDLVGVRVPEVDKGRSSVSNFPGIIVEVKEGGYRVRLVRESRAGSESV